jgi:flavin reductase
MCVDLTHNLLHTKMMIASPPQPPNPVLATLYRDGMSHVAGAVHIVTTGGDKGESGFTATAVTSVSDSPPTALVCLALNSRTLPLIQAHQTFCINTLGSEHQDLADVFAGRTGLFGHDRFRQGEWGKDEQGNPRLRQALTSFTCVCTHIQPVATHAMILGLVTHVIIHPQKALVYKDRAYVMV